MLKRVTAVSLLALSLALPAMAADQSQKQQSREHEQRSSSSENSEDRPLNKVTLAQGDTLKGSTVRNAQGEKVGEVEHLVVDVKKGQVAYAIIGVGGFLGIGQKSVAVPWDKLQPGQEKRTLTLNVDRQMLQSAPAIEPDHLALLEGEGARRDVAAFWGKAGASEQAQTPGQRPSGPAQQ